jgi:hypothetical protein
MNKENELEYLIAVYGIFFFTLTEYGLADKETAYPKKLKGKDDNQKNNDSIAVYKWLSEKIRGLSGKQLQERAKKFNNTVEALKDNFWLNQYLLGIFMLQHYLENEADTYSKNLILPKTTRLIKVMREGIINTNENGNDIILDSSKAASNVWRMFNGKAQLTKEVRDARIRMWKEAARNKSQKSLKKKYSLN